MRGFGFIGGLKLGLLALLILVLLPFQIVAVRLGPRWRDGIPRLFHRCLCFILGVRREIRGAPPAPGEGGLIVANHVSWLDISAIGAELPVSFVAKTEVGAWPVVGLLARLQRTVFIDRMRRSATASVASEMGGRIQAGEAVVLFAEGTTGDGTRILPLRSALLGAAREALGAGAGDEVMVHPLAITWRGFRGIPGGRSDRAALAWYGDTELAPHLKAMLRAGAIDVVLHWAEPIRMGRETSRKEATRRAEIAIRMARREAVTGRSCE